MINLSSLVATPNLNAQRFGTGSKFQKAFYLPGLKGKGAESARIVIRCG